ncbi:gluzincin family metallopeptidase [Rhizobium ruizarguesonis]|uniref:serine protease n=1 Tax=Rhizobium ruizarguesonis TaxID=2081791 RepID=UPI001031874F|nr:serine protease [Rhizobium ruizarguesonis]TBD71741.1 serine protease [Rhizobium ruizarguesonis]TBD94898.1 serine protease [Rhizobium ruizarguesonis]TBE14740.1 serine protease [Rhizobium ruizarguesonis]WSH04955.1 serine protease [Rhizobium ruizarguesonis]
MAIEPVVDGALRLSPDDLRDLYASRRFLDEGTRRKLGLERRFDVYYKDPLVAKENPGLEIDKNFYVPWEPGIGDGPTSARFAVVDFDSTTNKLEEPSRWDSDAKLFRDPNELPIDTAIKQSPQFRQVSTWAIVQNTLNYFEGPSGLGRRISWAFEGNRLLIVPNAGYGANAYYDRKSHSLQFYYFDGENGQRVRTCLSSDIVNHEFTHALLDGIRPHYLEAVSPQTGAFHEFLGDLTAILMSLRNTSFRQKLAERTGGLLDSKSGGELLSSVAAEFGRAVSGQEYLRSGANQDKLSKYKDEMEVHALSTVLTGTMFDILVKFTKQYLDRERADGKKLSAKQALAFTVPRMQLIAIQSLDLLPPVEVTFNDYARAVLRNLLIADPIDPRGYRKMIAEAFLTREILTSEEVGELLEPAGPYDRVPGDITHDPTVIASSRAEAYRYLDDNRDDLYIPPSVDIIVDEVFTSKKMVGRGLFMPKQVILQYLWREDVSLEGERFGPYSGQTTSLLCGATMVLDENGSMLSWARKPGSEPSAKAVAGQAKIDAGKKRNGEEERALADWIAGKERRAAYLEALARRIDEGMVGEELAGPEGLVGALTPPLIARETGGQVRFELSPHFHIHDSDDHDDKDEKNDDHYDYNLRGLRWKTSS